MLLAILPLRESRKISERCKRRLKDMKKLLLKFLLIALTLSFAEPVNAQELPGTEQSTPIALVGGMVHTITDGIIENGTVIFDQGKITVVGTDVDIPNGVETIDVSGKHVYPSLFETHSQLGLTEIDSVNATIDQAEIGDINSNAKANVAVNPDSTLIPVTRANGVLLALTIPTGGLISGQGSILQLDGWTYEDLTLAPQVAMKVEWPSTTISARRRARMTEEEIEEVQKENEERLVEMRKFFDRARTYLKARETNPSQQATDLRLEAMKSLLQKEQVMLVQADGLSEIESAVAFAIEQNVRIVIIGGYDYHLCADLLKENNIPVIVGAVYRTPRRRSEDFSAAYALASKLKHAGIQFAISGSGKNSTWNVRTLPDHAATAIAYGLDKKEALRAITLTPAQIYGVDEQVGSIEVGKQATLFVSTDDIFEIKSQVVHAFVQGRKVDLRSKHTRLYEKYREKYRRQMNPANKAAEQTK